jgi:DNA-binding response OmpR family regulator
LEPQTSISTDSAAHRCKLIHPRISPDLIFVDVLMPRLDGYQTCALIKRCAVYKRIPVIMLTSRDSLFDRANA